MAPTSMASAGMADNYYHAKQEKVSPVNVSSSVSYSDENPSAQLEDEEWVGCDGCSKWRKVPTGFTFDRSKSFFCSMIESLTCDTPEEQWDEEEEFVDRGHIIDDRSHDRNDSSRSTTPRGSSGDSHRRSGSKSKTLCEKGRPGSALSKDVASERATGKRKCFRPRSYGAEGDGEERWRRSRRAANGEDAVAGHGGQSDTPGQRANRGRAEGPAGGVQGMSRLDAVVRVLKATGKALHYNIITRQALQQGIIRFTGSQGTAGESMKAFLNKTIRENKTAAIVNMGKGVYGLKEWGRSGTAKEGPILLKDEAMDAPTSGGSGTTYGSAPSRSPSSVSVSSAQEDLVRGPTLGERKAGGGSAATSSDSQHSSFEEEDALSAPASPADTSLAVFPRAATPTDLGGGVSAGMAGMGGVQLSLRQQMEMGMGAGGLVGGMGGVMGGAGFGKDEIEGLDAGMGASTSWRSCPQSPSEFFSWSTGE